MDCGKSDSNSEAGVEELGEEEEEEDDDDELDEVDVVSKDGSIQGGCIWRNGGKLCSVGDTLSVDTAGASIVPSLT